MSSYSVSIYRERDEKLFSTVLRVYQQWNGLKLTVIGNQVFLKKDAVQKLRCQCIMCLSTRKQFKSCGATTTFKLLSFWVNALSQWIMCLSTRKQFKSCGVNASCFYQQRSSLKVAVSMHRVFVNKEAV